MTIPKMEGFAYFVRNARGREFLFTATFGNSRNKAKAALKSLQQRRYEQRQPELEVLGLCKVSIQIDAAEPVAWVGGAPSVSNLFVAEGCEPFK